MLRRVGPCLLALLCGCGRGCGRSGGTAPEPSPAADEAQLFSGAVNSFALTLDAAAMAELAREPRDWVQGALDYRGQRYEHVALRFKGHRSLRKWSSKPAFKLDFAKYDKGRRFLGQKTLVLNNMVEDPTMLRETLGYRVFRALGVPAPRSGYLELSVNGERFGLYAVLEAADEPFLARAFGGSDGVLYEGEYGCDVLADHVAGMGLESGEDPERRLLGALASAAEGPISKLFDGDGALLDAPRFFAFLAAGAWVADFDGYRHAHNYRLYYDPRARRWSLLPWGLDRVFDRDMDVFDSHELLASKCFAEAGCRLRYVQALHAALAKIDALDLPSRLDEVAGGIARAVARDSRRPYDDETRAKKLAETRAWLVARSAKVRAQIACWDGQHEHDEDHDGFGCNDCDDRDGSVHPGAAERCDGRDDDCTGVADDAASCACPEQTIEGARFALCDRAVSWQRAAELCTGQGAKLAYVDGKAQSRALGRAVKEARDVDWWIGLSDLAREGRRSWHGQVKESFRDWATGEPDDYACAEDCVAIKEDAEGRWHDMPCATPQPFVCRLP